MPMMLFPKCWRGRSDCVPFQAIDGIQREITEDEMMSLEYEPDSFVCCGCVAEAERVVPQDAYRVCWKNSSVDEMGEYDEQDLTHLLAVVTHALAAISSRRVNRGKIDVPTEEYGLKEVKTGQRHTAPIAERVMEDDGA